MKKLIIIMVCLGLIQACSPPDWEKTNIANADVSIEFPGKPEVKSEVSNSPVIGKIKFVTYQYKYENIKYHLQLTEMLDTDISGDRLYDSLHVLRRHIQKRGEILFENKNTYQGHDTFDVTYRDRKQRTVHHRVIKNGNRQYNLIVIFDKGYADRRKSDKFFNSLVFNSR